MPIDWFTVIAQAINFFVLLWLLKRFLYHPIIDALDAREKKIADILTNADEKKANAEKLQSDYEKKLANIEQQRQQVIADAQAQAQISAKTVIEEAVRDADTLHKKRKEAMALEMAHLQQDLLKKTINEIYAVCKKVLSDLANYDVHECMYKQFIHRINELSEHECDALNSALIASNNAVTVHSSFHLTEQQLAQLSACITDKCTAANDTKIILTQRIMPELIAGIEIVVGGWKTSWTMNHYLTMLQQTTEASALVSALDTHSSLENQASSTSEVTP